MTTPAVSRSVEGGRSAIDARVIHRALIVGAGVTGAVSGILVAGVVLIGGTGALGVAAVLTGVTMGLLAAAAWLLLSILLDLFADRSPGPRRLWWAVGLAAAGFVAPVFILGALRVAAQ